MRLIAGLVLGAVASLAPPAAAMPVRVIDGVTLEIGSVAYRLHGIDAPEGRQVCAAADGGTWACGRASTSYLRQLVAEGGEVACVSRSKDRFGRQIATCRAGIIDLNGTMVASGMAWAFTRFSTVYLPQESAARSQGLGIWQAPTQPPWEVRAATAEPEASGPWWWTVLSEILR